MDKQLTFGDALDALKSGLRVTREAWQSKEMWLSYVKDGNYHRSALQGYHDTELNPEGIQPWIGFKTPEGQLMPWHTRHADVLAEDWIIL